MTKSAVEFATPTRIHIGLAVRDVERSLAFYRTLFGMEPTKVRDGYAKFEVVDPPVNFSLNRAEEVMPHTGPQHFGVQVKSTDAVTAMKQRIEGQGFSTIVEDEVSCCYAVQDKIWATDPDGHRWEVFVVTQADAPHLAPPVTSASTQQRTCCEPTCCT